MAAERLIVLHIGKEKTVAKQSLKRQKSFPNRGTGRAEMMVAFDWRVEMFSRIMFCGARDYWVPIIIRDN